MLNPVRKTYLMATYPNPAPSSEQPIQRAELIAFLRAALAAGSLRFARQAALAWLAYYPGDLPVKMLYARCLLQSDRPDNALPLLESLCLADPEDLEAQENLCLALRQLLAGERLDVPQANMQITDCRAAIFALGGQPDAGLPLPVWAQGLRQARQALADRDLETAEGLIHQALLIEMPPPLVAVTHLKVAATRGLPGRAMQDLAGFYHLRFPGCQAPALLLAESLMEGGEAEIAVDLLHRAAGEDVTGQVAIRLWGARHPYRELWPEHLEAPLEVAIPADVAALLGRNRLPTPAQALEEATTAPEQDPITMAPPETGAIGEPGSASIPVDQPVIIQLGAAASLEGRLEAWNDGRMEAEENPASIPDPAGEESVSRQAEPAASQAKAMDSGRAKAETAQPSSLPTFQTSSSPSLQPYTSIPESLRSVQSELERVAANLKQNQLARADGRFPIYVVFSTQQGLRRQYGSKVFPAIDLELKRLVAAVAARRDWGAILVYADDPASMAAFGLQPAQPSDPWSLKLVLADLDAFLARQGEMIGALLIAGGPEVVPFHFLPNPVDDADADVPSDNPYATRDENYFVPEWPVARLPGGNQASAQPMLQALRRMSEHHVQAAKTQPWFRRWWLRLRSRLWPRSRSRRPSWGYTAAVWRRASLSVFRPIGEPQAMLVSPPAEVNGNPGRTRRNGHLPSARLGYFNLHGLQDASEWYGQRDPSEPADGPDYPVALRPKDVMNGGGAPQVVFSEACYGAHIQDKNTEQALALKFLVSGAQAVAGSTCTAYGSIAAPLIAADLLGHAFWKFLREGLPAGEALRRAKIYLAREMHRRQGYLDGEDQKTLISFILYGDPLARISDIAPRSKSVLRTLKPPKVVKTVCDRSTGQEPVEGSPAAPPIPAEMLAHVKQVVEQYLPGMLDAQLSFNREYAGCQGIGHSCPTSHLGSKSQPETAPERSVVVLSKHVLESGSAAGEPGEATDETRVHHHYARLTFDARGEVVKVAVSR
jgi:hypothetical protein